jgi:hypothetical protein
MVVTEGFHFKKQRGLNLQGKAFVVNVIDATIPENDKLLLSEFLVNKLRDFGSSVRHIFALESKGHEINSIPYYADTVSLNYIAQMSSADFLINSMASEIGSNEMGNSFVVGLILFDLHTHEMIYEQAIDAVDSELGIDARFSFTIYKSDKKVIKHGLAALVRDLRKASKP